VFLFKQHSTIIYAIIRQKLQFVDEKNKTGHEKDISADKKNTPGGINRLKGAQ